MLWAAGGDEMVALLAKLRSIGVREEGLEIESLPPEPLERLLASVTERIGPPSILVDNAANTRAGYEKLDTATLDVHYAVNLRAATLLSAGPPEIWKGIAAGLLT